MHIKKLEITGFKSFVDRTVIHFDHDVIGVVGPNGCGKSNIVDAIRWCMGEQSAKHLRGRSMEDVIFNGSESRAAHGLAEVTIVFDNSDPSYAATLPLEYKDYPEIAVTRRLFRDGTSEYLINRTQVRLRDITDLFLGTGVGTKAYSIVEQGRIGQIVSARPEDRRLFLEEAAGITKYKQRKKQAERKMELTRQNLLRVNDIIAEIERTRAALKRQVAKAERFIVYRAELEDLTLHEASHRLLEFIVTERVERESLAESTGRAAELRESLDRAESELELVRARASETEARSDAASRRAFEADNDVSSLQAEMQRARDRLAHLTQRLEAAQNEKEQIQCRLGELENERTELAERIAQLGKDQDEREADAAAEVEALEALRLEEANANQEVQELRQMASEASSQAAAADARLEALAQRIADAHARRDRLSSERQTLVSELSSLEARKSALERSVAEAAEGKLLTQAERESLEREMHELRSRQLDSERAVDTAKNELGLRRNRLRALEELHRRLEGVGTGARTLLSRSDPAVLGILADRIEAPEELTAAVAGLLGDRLQYVVVSDLPRGLGLLAELKQSERGRATIVSQRPSYTAGGHASFAAEPGVIGLLCDRLVYSPSDEPLVRALVGDAVVVDTPADAVAFVQRHAGMTAVALDGTVARPDGGVSGGGGDEVASAMLEQKREMHQLANDVTRLEAEFSKLSAEHNALRARLSEVGTALDRARQEAHLGELAHVSAQKDLAKTAGDIERAEARRRALDAELAEVEQALDQANESEQESRRALDELKAQVEHTHHDLARAESRAAAWRERVAAQAALVTERKVRLAQVKEQMEAARSSSERVASLLEELATRIRRLEVEMDEAATSYGQTAAQLMLSVETKAAADEEAKSAHAELDEARALLDQVRHELGQHENGMREIRSELVVADDGVRRHEMAQQRIELERLHLIDNIREKFRGLDLYRVVGDYHARPAPDPEHHRRIEELTQLIDRMGPVNLDAKSEFDDAEKRFVDLSTQRDDIEKALADLDKAIRHMNKESRRRFRETFDCVNALFRKTFTRMFRGGRAELQLTENDDILNAGVDIIAQPPGKKLGNIELMSGGEKALTAASLIFAIFQHRPSPFCVLDEVDAPLDEANVARYNEAIREMTNHSQFILITHVRKTMQSVDVLYGVTMGEPGVSRVVSVKVNEAAQVRSDSRHPGIRDTVAPGEAAPAVASGSTQVA
jgi:chromosome segregation protein